MSDLRVRALTEWEAVERELGDVWDELLPRRPHRCFFSSLGVIRLWWEHLRPEDARLHVAVAEENGQPVGFLPLFHHAKRKGALKIRTLSLLGGGQMEFLALPVPEDRPDVIAALLRHLRAEAPAWDVLTLDEQDIADPRTDLVRSVGGECGLLLDEKISALCPALPIDRPFEALWHGLYPSGKSRNTRMRKIRKTEEIKGVAFHVWKEGDPLDPALKTVAKLERDSWKGHEDVGLFTEDVGDWHTDLIRLVRDFGGLDLRWITVGAHPAAYRVGFLWDGCFYDFNTAYHPDVAKESPSGVLLHRVIEMLCERDAHHLDFCRGVQRYKLEWATQLRENHVLRFFQPSLKGKVLCALAAKKRARAGDQRPELSIPIKDPLPPHSED